MGSELEKNASIHKEMLRLEMIEGLRHALDRNCRRLLKTARADWERLFSGKDPSDACVSVRATVGDSESQTRSVRGSGFLKARKPSHAKQRRSLPRFAH
jgi:hypothetical protein